MLFFNRYKKKRLFVSYWGYNDDNNVRTPFYGECFDFQIIGDITPITLDYMKMKLKEQLKCKEIAIINWKEY